MVLKLVIGWLMLLMCGALVGAVNYSTVLIFDDFNDNSTNTSIWTNSGCSESSAQLTCSAENAFIETLNLNTTFGFNHSKPYNLTFTVVAAGGTGERECAILTSENPSLGSGADPQLCRGPESFPANNRHGVYSQAVQNAAQWGVPLTGGIQTTKLLANDKIMLIGNGTNYTVYLNNVAQNSNVTTPSKSIEYFGLGDWESDQTAGLITIDDFRLAIDNTTAVVAAAPVIITLNFTSDAPPEATCAFPDVCATTADTTPTFELVTDEGAKCKMSTSDQNYSVMALNCTPADHFNTSHTCTQDVAVSPGANNLFYFACVDSGGTANNAPLASAHKANLTITLAPTVSLNSPANGSVLANNRDITLNFTAIDDSATFACNLYVNGTNRYTNGSVGNNTLISAPITGLSIGQRNWSVNCTDTGGTTGRSGAFFFNITDTIAPNATLQTPQNSSVAAGSTNFFFIMTDNFENNASCVLFTNDVSRATNATTINNTNTSLAYTVTNADKNWSVNCTDFSGNVGASGHFILGNVSLNITLNGLAANRKYEIGRTVDIDTTSSYTGTICVDVTNNVNVSCFTGSLSGNETNWTVANITLSLFNQTRANVTLNYSPSGFFIDLDNRTELDNATLELFGISASGSYPENVTLDENNDSIIDYVIPCALEENRVHCRYFTHDAVRASSRNLTFATAGAQTFHVNISTIAFEKYNGSTAAYGNFTLMLTGFNQNSGQTLTKVQDFVGDGDVTNITTGINLSSALWEDFNSNWSVANSFTDVLADCSSNTFTTSSGDLFIECDVNTGAGGRTRVVETSRTAFDWRDFANTTISWRGSWASCAEDSRPFYKFKLSDGTTQVQLFSYQAGTSTGSADRTLSFVKNSAGEYDVYDEGAFVSTVSPTGLSSTANWSLYLSINTGESFNCKSDLSLHNIQVSSIGLAFNGTGTAKRLPNGSIESGQLSNFSTNITGVYLDANDYIRYPANQTITYYISCNNGTNWDVATKGVNNICTVPGIRARYRIEVNTTDPNRLNETPYIHEVTTRVLGGVPENVSIDVGANGVNDYNFVGFLNGTNKTLNISIDADRVVEYLNGSCRNILTCNVPVKITVSSAGIVQVSRLNITQNLGNFRLNVTKLDNTVTSIINMVVRFTNGNVAARNLRLLYYGSANLTVFAHTPDYLFNSTSYQIRARYSKFDVILPPFITDFDFFATSGNAKNVQPFGQNTTTGIWRVTSQAYEDSMNIYLTANETSNSCLAIYSDVNYNHTNPRLLNTSTANASALIILNLNVSQANVSIWQRANLTSCTSSLFVPAQQFDSQCAGCVEAWS